MNLDKTKVSSFQFGQVLFIFALKEYESFKENKKLLKSLGLKKNKKEYHFFREVIVINLFVITQSIEGIYKNQKLEFEILDQMNLTYFSYLQSELNFEDSQINEQKRHLLFRFDEYNKAMSEKRGPNVLWPLPCHMINNLRREETKDPFAVTEFIVYYSYLLRTYPAMISVYEIE